MYVSCSCLVCDKRKYPTVQESLRKIKELGFNAFDLDALENWQRINPSELAAGNEIWVEQFVDMVANLELKVSSINCSLSKELTDPDPVAFKQYKKEFLALLDLSERVNSSNITLQPGPIPKGYSHEGALNVLRIHLLELCQLKTGYHASVSLEGHANTVIEDHELALDVIKGFWPGMGFTYDPSHFVMREIELNRTERLLDYTVHVHVRNASSGKMQDTMVNGKVDIEWLINALKAHSYDGALTIEYFENFDYNFENVLALRKRLIELGVEA